jgi:hypothetical protein
MSGTLVGFPGSGPRGRSPWPTRLLRAVLPCVFLGLLAGGGLLVASFFVTDLVPRSDALVLPSGPGGAGQVVVLELPPGWRVKHRSKVFTPEGDFAFDVIREREPAFLEARRKPRGASKDLIVFRRKPRGASEDLIVFSPVRRLCLVFRTRAGDGARLEPAALRLFEAGQVLPPGDERARKEEIDPRAHARKQALRWGGVGLLGACVAMFLALPWAGVYVQVIEASRGQPVPKPIKDPTLKPAREVPTDALAGLAVGQDGLASLGFEPTGWFWLDNFAQLRVGAWRHCSHPAVAFVLFQPGGAPRLRIVRRFKSGAILTTTNKLTDVAAGPPASMYVQMCMTRSAAELWSWHLQAEMLFEGEASRSRPGENRVTRSPGDFAPRPAPFPFRADPNEGPSDPMEVFMEALVRWGWMHRSQRLWLLKLNPFRECWRMWNLCGLSLEQQIAEGWATAPWLRERVCLPLEEEDDWSG